MKVQEFEIGSKEWDRLYHFMCMLNIAQDYNQFTIHNTYYDVGANMKWTTIVGYDTTEYQLLYFKDWEKIVYGTEQEFLDTFYQLSSKIIERKY